MKPAIVFITAYIAWVALCYLFMAFSLWEINAGNWKVADRGLVCFIGGFLGLMVAALLTSANALAAPKK